MIAQEGPGILWHVRWNGYEFDTTEIASVAQWEHVTFSTAGIVEIPPTIDLPPTITGVTSNDNPGNNDWHLGPETVTLTADDDNGVKEIGSSGNRVGDFTGKFG